MKMKMPTTPIWPTESLKFPSHCWTGKNLIARSSPITSTINAKSRPLALFPLASSTACAFIQPAKDFPRSRGQPPLVVFVSRLARQLGQSRIGVDGRCNFAQADLRAHHQEEFVQQISRRTSHKRRSNT